MTRVSEFRSLPPSLCGPEIACLDPGCPGVHHINFRSGETMAGRAYAEFEADAPLSPRMLKLLADLRRPDDMFFSHDNSWGLPWLVTGALSRAERRLLLERLLKTNSEGLRELANVSLGRNTKRKTADQIAADVDDAVFLQLILQVSDRRLVDELEVMVKEGLIPVSPTETRWPLRMRHAEGGYFRTVPELSGFGVRFRPRMTLGHLPLRSFVKSLYDGGEGDELEWLLRDQAGPSADDRLERFLTSAPPEEIVRRLVFTSRARISASFATLHFGHFEQPDSADDEAFLVKRILWKLGGSLPAPPPPERATLAALEAFERVSSSCGDRTDESIDSLRSTGMNACVRLEALLADTLDFICWLLLDDHYQVQRELRFTYRHSSAAAFARARIAEGFSSTEGRVFDIAGRNSLGTLSRGYRVVDALVRDAVDSRDANVRPDSETPFAAMYAGLFEFPFRHKSLAADLTDDSVELVSRTLRGVADVLDGGHVIEVRNGLSHARETFPGVGDVSDACAGMRRAVAMLQSSALLPTIYVFATRETDQYGRSTISMLDGDQRQVMVHRPSEVVDCGMPAVDVPQLIPHRLTLRGVSQAIRLRYVDESVFTELLAAHSPLRFDQPLEAGATTELVKSVAQESSVA